MSERVTDDDVRAMLEGRSAALSPGADREVLAAARATIAAPVTKEGAAVSFPVRRVEAVRRRSRMPWMAGAVAAAAIVAFAVLGGRVQLDRPAATTGPAGSAGVGTDVPGNSAIPTPGATVNGSLPAASAGTTAAATTLTIEQLRDRLRAGELDGKTVIVTADASLAPGRCPYRASPDPADDCIFIRLDGLPGQFVNKGDRTADQVQAEIDAYGATTPMVLRGRDGGLVLLGWVVAGGERALPPDGPALLRRGIQDDGLVAVSGWLQTEGVEQITETAQPDAAQGLIVDIDPSVETSPDAPAEGTFLLEPDVRTNRLSDIIRWQVLANLSSSSTVYVARPTPDVPAATVSAADVIAALADGSLDGQVLAIDGELKTVAAECPLDARPCERFYVDGLPGVAITWDGGTLGSDGTPGGPVSATSGRLLVTPRRGPLDTKHGYLELLGILEGAIDRPMHVEDLAAATVGGAVLDPMRVDAVDGWLVANGAVSCPMIRPGQDPAVVCPLGQPFLSPIQPGASLKPTDPGNLRVSLHPAAAGVGPTPIRQAGPFLVRYAEAANGCIADGRPGTTCTETRVGGWTVVARYDPGTVRVVTVR